MTKELAGVGGHRFHVTTLTLREDCVKRQLFFFFNDTATTEIYTLSLHDALPISMGSGAAMPVSVVKGCITRLSPDRSRPVAANRDRKSTRLNSSHANISYAVFCLKKKKQKAHITHLKKKKSPQLRT